MKSNKPINFSYYKNKRAFLLIEILVAFLIISMVTVPLIRNPIYFFKHQIKSLEKLECERLADLTFLDVKEESYKDKSNINVHDISPTEKGAEEITLEPYLLDTFNQKIVKRWYKLYSRKRPRENLDGKICKLVHVKIYLQPEDIKKEDAYTYRYRMICKEK